MTTGVILFLLWCTFLVSIARVWPSCCEVWRHVGSRKSNYCACPGATLLHEPSQATTASCSIHKCCVKNLIIFKFEPTTPNMSQHVTTGWPNARKMLRPKMLRYVALKCCDRLAGALNLKLVKFFMQHFWMLHDVLVVWPRSCNNVAPGLAH